MFVRKGDCLDSAACPLQGGKQPYWGQTTPFEQTPNEGARAIYELTFRVFGVGDHR